MTFAMTFFIIFCDDFSYKKDKNLWLKAAFFFFFSQKHKNCLYLHVRKNVETVDEYPHEVYYRSKQLVSHRCVNFDNFDLPSLVRHQYTYLYLF